MYWRIYIFLSNENILYDFYARRLFTKYPEYIPMFKSFRDLPNLPAIMASAPFRAHSVRFMGALCDIMENLEDENCLVELLNRLAESHKPRNITMDDFKVRRVVIYFIIFVRTLFY